MDKATMRAELAELRAFRWHVLKAYADVRQRKRLFRRPSEIEIVVDTLVSATCLDVPAILEHEAPDA